MAIVWPCTLSVDAYAAAGREVEVPRADCPSCHEPMVFWSGYSRFVRHEGGAHKIWIPRGACARCGRTHALLPAFVALKRLDSIETIGAVLESVASGDSGVRPVAKRLGIPHTTVRGWLRHFGRRAASLALSFAALAVELGGEALLPRGDPRRDALGAMTAAWMAACALPGWLAVSMWRFCSAVCGGALVATNTNSPYLIVGRRRFMPPVT
jgi:transposase-like protein